MKLREPDAEEVKLLKEYKLNISKWLVVWSDKEVLEIVSKRTRQRRILRKGK